MPELHHELGMTDLEYTAVIDTLNREPTEAELMMYSLMWSEHCSYKSSLPHLRDLPSDGPQVVVGPGGGAGVVDLGGGWLAALRIESHNHPSFVEPYQGAATGVGGILRDVLSMGARPIALWNQIRFGELSDPRVRYLFDGVVSGIAGYGNAVGVPTLGGEVAFEPCFEANPLVNVMCLGILRSDDLVPSGSLDNGDVAVLLGAPTGRDGIGGASILASASFSEEDVSKRPAVQVGDPFAAKKLIETCLELASRRLLVGLQDLGAAGIACAASETAAGAGSGMDLALDAMPRREDRMSPAELLVSESQERMLAVVAIADLPAALEVARRWEIEASPVGTMTAGGTLRVFDGDSIAAEVPAESLADGAPVASRPAAKPGYIDEVWAAAAEPQAPLDVGGALLGLLDQPALASKAWVYEQYDHMLGMGTVVGPGHDGALLRLRGTQKGLAVSTDGNSRRCLLDPRRGTSRLVFEAALNVAVTGAKPIGLVDNLNFGDPEQPGVMWQFVEAVAGLSDACRSLEIPIVGGNVSFYNSSDSGDIMPTPVIAMLGLADPMPETPPRLDAATDGMGLWLIAGGGDVPDFAASAYAKLMDGELVGRPLPADPVLGKGVIDVALQLAGGGHAAVVHDISEGGLALALTEICMMSGVGAKVDIRDWRILFGEAPHRVLVASDRSNLADLVDLGDAVRVTPIGRFGGDVIHFGDAAPIAVVEAAAVWRNAIPRRMAGRSR